MTAALGIATGLFPFVLVVIGMILVAKGRTNLGFGFGIAGFAAYCILLVVFRVVEQPL